jgi:hypothetical protein
MNRKDCTFPAPQPAAARGLGEVFDDFEAGLARSVADGSRLARVLMQLLVMLRDALARFAAGVAAGTALADLAAVPAASRPRPMRARDGRVASARAAALRVVVIVGVASAVAPVAMTIWVWVRDGFAVQWAGDGQVGFSKSLCLGGKICVLFVTIS